VSILCISSPTNPGRKEADASGDRGQKAFEGGTGVPVADTGLVVFYSVSPKGPSPFRGSRAEKERGTSALDSSRLWGGGSAEEARGSRGGEERRFRGWVPRLVEGRGEEPTDAEAVIKQAAGPALEKGKGRRFFGR